MITAFWPTDLMSGSTDRNVASTGVLAFPYFVFTSYSLRSYDPMADIRAGRMGSELLVPW